jgi:cytochrome c-type biogenesis protein CcmH/NrfF
MTKHKENQEDQIVRDLFHTGFEPEKLNSKDFNRHIMDRVMTDWVAQLNYYQPIVDKQNRWWIVPGVLVIFALGFMYDAGLFTGNSQFQWVDNLGASFQSLYSWIKPVHLLVIGASLAVGLLLAVDQLLQKLSNI